MVDCDLPEPTSVFATPPGLASYEERVPPAELRPCVASLWRVRARDAAVRHRVLPDGCVDIVVDESHGVRVVGTALAAEDFPVEARAVVVGARLRPGAAPGLLGVHAAELAGGHASLDALGLRAPGLQDRSPADALDPLAAFLGELARRRRASDALVTEALALLGSTPGEVRVGALARRLAISERQLHRRFTQAVGLAPKRYARILRMQRVLAFATEHPVARGHWPRVALRFGFFDEAHMVNDVSELAGVSPARLAAAVIRGR